MEYFSYIWPVLVAFSFFVAWKVTKKGKDDEKGGGCFFFGYVALVVGIISMFSVLITLVLTETAVSHIGAIYSGEKCIATVVSYSDYESDDEDGGTITMYTPEYRVVASDNKAYNVVSKTSSSKEPRFGEEISVYFDTKTANIVELTASTVIMFCGMFIMWAVLVAVFGGIIMYALDVKMDKYFAFLKIAGTCFFLPFIMICFEALLIFALFGGNSISSFATIILLFFIIVLGFAIWAYISLLIKKGAPKWKRTGAGSWSADWVDDADVSKKEIPKQKKKKMVPLNEKYLKDTDNYQK